VFCRYADDCNIYVRSRAAGKGEMSAITRFLPERLKRRANPDKNVVNRPGNRKFLGYGMTFHGKPKMKAAPGV
jgi:RNA-directed DNA polymerase